MDDPNRGAGQPPTPQVHVVHHYHTPPVYYVAPLPALPSPPRSRRRKVAIVVGLIAAPLLLAWLMLTIHHWLRSGDVSDCIGRSPSGVPYEQARRACERDTNAY